MAIKSSVAQLLIILMEAELFSGCLLGQVFLLGAVSVVSEMQQGAIVKTMKTRFFSSLSLTSSVLILLVWVSVGLGERGIDS